MQDLNFFRWCEDRNLDAETYKAIKEWEEFLTQI